MAAWAISFIVPKLNWKWSTGIFNMVNRWLLSMLLARTWTHSLLDTIDGMFRDCKQDLSACSDKKKKRRVHLFLEFPVIGEAIKRSNILRKQGLIGSLLVPFWVTCYQGCLDIPDSINNNLYPIENVILTVFSATSDDNFVKISTWWPW